MITFETILYSLIVYGIFILVMSSIMASRVTNINIIYVDQSSRNAITSLLVLSAIFISVPIGILFSKCKPKPGDVPAGIQSYMYTGIICLLNIMTTVIISFIHTPARNDIPDPTDYNTFKSLQEALFSISVVLTIITFLLGIRLITTEKQRQSVIDGIKGVSNSVVSGVKSVTKGKEPSKGEPGVELQPL